MKVFIRFIFLLLLTVPGMGICQPTLWHGKERDIHYQPRGDDFVNVNGKLRFNRALYGTNTGFRVEAGDLPEFALYMPGMGGNFKLGLKAGDRSKWLIDADHITTEYRNGSMVYSIHDALLGKGQMDIFLLALDSAEGFILKINFLDVGPGIEIFWAFGGATGKRFSRDGDIGADPESSFYLQPENCKDNQYQLLANSFRLQYGGTKKMAGVFPAGSVIKLADATQQQTPLALYGSSAAGAPVVTGKIAATNNENNYEFCFLIQNGEIIPDPGSLQHLYYKAERALKKVAERIVVNTPDPYINTLGSTLSLAADAIWESPTYMHGAIAWRMRLPAWRGAYVADVLGWHDRARTHFSSYALSQVTEPLTAPVVMDTALHLARHQEKMGTAMFSSGYICRNPNGDIRPHHYDMNLVFIDQLLNHFYWTGDTAYVRQMWPMLERHFAWEKRNFDADGDGLYDAYCCIWASDGLQYSGGGVAHSSAYNYRANHTMADLAKIIGKDDAPWKQEADKIHAALEKQLWLPQQGHYAEYKDLLGLQNIHPAAGLWTIYHLLDARVPDPFKAYQSLRYVDTDIPHIPVVIKGLPVKDMYLLATSNWQPYTWSVNNVALAENLHASLAYWQGNRPDDAYRLWKSTLIESMYASSSPGGFQQLSFYDAVRGELYRDFADGIGMAGRSLVEGLFGITPDLLHGTLTIKPGFPADWKFASLETPDINIQFRRAGNTDTYVIESSLGKPLNLQLVLRARKVGNARVKVYDKEVGWSPEPDAVGHPLIRINAGKGDKHIVQITWKGDAPEVLQCDSVYVETDVFRITAKKAVLGPLYDPQKALNEAGNPIPLHNALYMQLPDHKTVFQQLKQGSLSWWQPLSFTVKLPVEIKKMYSKNQDSVVVQVVNRMKKSITGDVTVNYSGVYSSVKVNGKATSAGMHIPAKYLIPGSNKIEFYGHSILVVPELFSTWNVQVSPAAVFEKIDLSSRFNEKVTNIYKQQYLSPRPTSPTLQLPVQGIGNWCYPLTEAVVDDSGLRKAAGKKNEIMLPQGIPFATPGDTNTNNIVFISQWNNYPKEVTIPLSGSAVHVYLLMAGSTNPMQSQLINGEIVFNFTDRLSSSYPLINPVNWYPIEQDYYDDGFAFTTRAGRPLRYYLKKGIASTTWNEYITIRGFSNRGIDGGAATILDFPLRADGDLVSVTVRTLANDVVIGLMSLTLQRE